MSSIVARVKKAGGSVLKIMKTNGHIFIIASAIAAALPPNAFAQSLDRIEGGRAIQIMPVPQILGVYNGASVRTGHLRANRSSSATRSRIAPGKVRRRH